MTTRVGINGFGRIGRTFYRALLQSGADLDLVAANDVGSRDLMAHLLKFDSVAGRLEREVRLDGDRLHAGDDTVQLLSEADPTKLPWKELEIDVVIESSRLFTDADKAVVHLQAGARCVVVSAPSKGADATFVMGVNHDSFDPAKHHIVSNASCTTNCFVPMVKVLDEAFGIEQGLMTTAHAYTTEQNLMDGPGGDPRRARAAAINIVPAATGAARATSLVLPEMAGRLDGSALRVPVPDGSITDFTAILQREVTREEVNEAFHSAAERPPLHGILEYADGPLVSSDIVGCSASCVFDSQLTIGSGRMVKVFGWYDNEWGYSNRLVDLIDHIGHRLAGA